MSQLLNRLRFPLVFGALLGGTYYAVDNFRDLRGKQIREKSDHYNHQNKFTAQEIYAREGEMAQNLKDLLKESKKANK